MPRVVLNYFPIDGAVDVLDADFPILSRILDRRNDIQPIRNGLIIQVDGIFHQESVLVADADIFFDLRDFGQGFRVHGSADSTPSKS